ncbi:MAG: dihydroorotate dehydrogenase [Candidatus Gygaella obscura]|nr:dihydroorotate dehydrogenase [Candidatus Gygaella obscura]
MDTKVKIAKLELKNPITVASGTFGYGQEFKEIIDLNDIAAIITKTITPFAREGNSAPRIIEASSGMINSIGLENQGLDDFLKYKLPQLRKLKTKTIVSIAGFSKRDFIVLAQELNTSGVDAIELNLSCPNLNKKIIAQDIKLTAKAVSAVKKYTKKTLIVKLSPNVTDIAELAFIAQDCGADAVSLVNTFSAMAIDIIKRKPALGNIVGGLSGPAIKPMAIKMVFDVFKKIRIPIVGVGGIADFKDALEFMMAGAKVVSVGSINFVNPKASLEIASGIKNYMRKNKIKNINRIIGCAHEKNN